MKNSRFFILLVFGLFVLFPSGEVIAQNQGRIWYFGTNAGLSFTTDPPSALTDGQLNTTEGCATICDASANLLFYTDGISVWNRNHVVMPNGTGLLGNPSSTQSGIIVPDPGNVNKYYVFEVSAYSNSNSYFSKVDMTLNGGLGDIEAAGKNTTLLLGTDESIAAVPSSDATFWWIIVHQRGTSNWYAFRLTATGVDTVSPVVSAVGTATQASGDIGHIKSNAAGTRLAFNTYFGDYTEAFDFNNATGVVSNAIHMPQPDSYGAEFSPNGNLLYVCAYSSTIYQYDLLAGSEALINSTRYALNTSATSRGALQAAPDGKIYIAIGGSTTLDVINSPNTIGAGCNYVTNAQAVGGMCQIGLPNIIASYVSTGPPQIDSLAHTNITSTGATISANVSTDGGSPITARGFFYGTSPNPTGNQTLVAGTTGAMSADISGLTPGTTYYYRAFATNSNGTANIGDGTFTTGSGPGNHTVTFQSSANGWLAGTLVQTVAPGGSTTPVTAFPDRGYRFVEWSGGYSGTANPLVIHTVSADMTVYAYFHNDPPQVEIVTPLEGNPVSGVVTVRAQATDDTAVTRVEFFVDGEKKGEASAVAPKTTRRSGQAGYNGTYTFTWNVMDYPMGSHTIRVVAWDEINFSGADVVTVTSVQVQMGVKAERKEVRSWSMVRFFADITMTVDLNGIPVTKFRLLRRKGTGSFEPVREISPAEVVNGTLHIQDKYIDGNSTYTYQFEAYSATGHLVGFTPLITI